jgi:mRNA interferase MazF
MTPAPPYTAGDIVLADLGDTFGHAQAGKRPCIVITVVHGMVLCVPCTSNPNALRFTHTLSISSTPENGLTQDSVALLFQLRSLDARRMITKLGVLSVNDKGAVVSALQALCSLA